MKTLEVLTRTFQQNVEEQGSADGIRNKKQLELSSLFHSQTLILINETDTYSGMVNGIANIACRISDAT